MSVLITGARGFIGRALVKRLAAAGECVVGLGHGQWPDAAEAGLRVWQNGAVDAVNLGLVAAAAGGFRVIYHLAGGSSVGPSLASPHEDFNRTVGSSAAILEWLRREAPATRLVAVSSAAVYGAAHAAPIPEDAAPAPLSPYGAHKAMMETLIGSYARNFAVLAAIARPFSVYGAGLRKQLLWDLAARLDAEEAYVLLGGTGNELRDWVHVEDAVDGLLRLEAEASAAAPQVNIGTGAATSVREVAELLADALGRPGAVRFSGLGRPGDPARLVANPARLLALGWTPKVPLVEGIAAYARWRRAGGADG